MNTNENPKTLPLVDTFVDTATEVAQELIRLEAVQHHYEALKAEIGGNTDASAIYKVQALKHSERALDVWSDKSEWVQRTAQPLELGMHRADVMKARIENLEKSNQHLVNALKLIKSAENTSATVEYVKGIAQAALWKSGQK